MPVLEGLVEHVVWVVVYAVERCGVVTRRGNLGELFAEVGSLLVRHLCGLVASVSSHPKSRASENGLQARLSSFAVR